MSTANNSRPCNYVYFFLLGLLAITSFGFGSYYTEARMYREGGAALAGTNDSLNSGSPQAAAPTPQPEIDPTKVPAVSAEDKVRGNPSAKIALIEYSD